MQCTKMFTKYKIRDEKENVYVYAVTIYFLFIHGQVNCDVCMTIRFFYIVEQEKRCL